MFNIIQKSESFEATINKKTKLDCGLSFKFFGSRLVTGLKIYMQRVWLFLFRFIGAFRDEITL